jgi:hypothetical protein
MTLSNKEYTDEEMVEEITVAIEEIGGTVTSIDVFNNVFKLSIDPELQQQAHLIINDITTKYRKKRADLLLKNPFIRAKSIRDELYG